MFLCYQEVAVTVVACGGGRWVGGLSPFGKKPKYTSSVFWFSAVAVKVL